MSDQIKKPRRWLKWSLWGVAGLTFFLLLSVIALRVFITTDSGARFIESKLNNRNLGPIERVEVSGLSGDPLDSLTIQSIKIYDKEGVWLTARDVAIDWNPWALRGRVVDVNSATSDAVDLLRRPVLNESETAGELPVIQLETASINAFFVSEAILGQSAIFSLSGAVSTDKAGEIKALIDVVRTDVAGDQLHLDFTRDARGDMSGDFNLNGAPGGTMAALLRAPNGTEVVGTGQIGGSLEKGQGDVTISFGRTSKVSATGNWTNTDVTLQGAINTVGWPVFDSVRPGLGEDIDVTANLNRDTIPAAFDVEITSGKLKVSATGQLNPEGGLPEAAQIEVSSDNIGAILPLPEGYSFGAGQITGRVQTSPKYRFTGDMSAADVISPYGQMTSIAGPLALAQQSEGVYQIDGKWVATDLKTDIELPVRVSSETTLEAKATLNTKTSRVNNLNMALSSGGNRVKVLGGFNYDALTYDLKGDTQLKLDPVGALPSGRLQSEFVVKKANGSLPAFLASGAFKPDVTIKAPFDQIVTGGVNFDVNMSPIDGGIRINNAALSGENIKAAVMGRITDIYDIEGEALLSAPFSYDPIALSGETSASFTLTGDRVDPNLRLDARTNQADINGYELKHTRVRMELTDILQAPTGPLRLTADTAQGELDFSTNFASREQVYAANDIDLSWGPLSASGNISKPVSGPATGRLSLNLPEEGDQYAKAELLLSSNAGTQAISLNANAKNISYNEWGFDSLVIKANGDLPSLSGQVKASGQRQLEILERQFNIDAPFTLTRSEEGSFEATLSPDAYYGNIVLGAASPITARYQDGGISVNAPLTLSGSPFDVLYERLASNETLALKTEGLPVTLIPMAGNLADTRGRIAANIEFSSSEASPSVTGGGVIKLSDWRGFDIEKGSGLLGDISLDLAGSQLALRLSAQSPLGFEADSESLLPVLQSRSIFALRPDMTAPVSGQFTASGQAAAILSLLTPSDAKPSGQVNANLILSGTPANPEIKGQARVQDLRMEAPDLGTQLRNGRFTADFTNDTLSVRDVSVTDNDVGTITGQGQFKLGEFARPIGELNMTAKNFRALDRKDYEGTVSGKLGFKSTKDKATITGDVTLNRAEVKQFVSGGAAVVEIPVEEINKPNNLKIVEMKTAPTPIDLDVKLRAPRRIFVRSRGLDVELSIDSTLKGSIGAVEIYGEANVLRGGYKIAGKELAFESGGIKFNGNLGEASVNLVANTETQNLSASVTITGTVANPEIELSSMPERPQDEILSALLFGRSATELSTIEAAQLAGALAQFSGAGGGFDLMGGLRDALGVGQLSIGIGQNGAAQITGGRYLAKNVYLQVFSGGGKGQTGAEIDWEIRKNISLTSKVQADNEQSFSLKWKRDF